MPFDLDHHDISALGFRFGALAYMPDVKRIPDASRAFLEGLECRLSTPCAIGHRPHCSLDEALSWMETMRPRRAILTQLRADLDYEHLAREAAGVCDAGL